jgi:CubicO group peptidase (beta-lactamase class C family)
MFTSEDLAITNAVVVVQGGRVVVERYSGVREYFDRAAEPITNESPLISWSMAKSMLHCVIGTLVEAGELNPEDLAPVPEWSDEQDPRHQIRLRDLLAMRDGLAFNESYVLGEPSHVIEMLFGEGQRNMAAFAACLPLLHAPGSVFNYSSGTTNIRVGSSPTKWATATPTEPTSTSVSSVRSA